MLVPWPTSANEWHIVYEFSPWTGGRIMSTRSMLSSLSCQVVSSRRKDPEHPGAMHDAPVSIKEENFVRVKASTCSDSVIPLYAASRSLVVQVPQYLAACLPRLSTCVHGVLPFERIHLLAAAFSFRRMRNFASLEPGKCAAGTPISTRRQLSS